MKETHAQRKPAWILRASDMGGKLLRCNVCRTRIEMSGLSRVEMSSFGSCSVDSPPHDERGTDGPEREGAGSDIGVEASEGGSVDACGGSGAAGGDAAAFPADAAAVRGRGRRDRGSRSARAAVEPVAAGRGSGAGDGRRDGSAVPGLWADAACRAPGAELRRACERGDAAELDAGGRCVGPASRPASTPRCTSDWFGATGSEPSPGPPECPSFFWRVG